MSRVVAVLSFVSLLGCFAPSLAATYLVLPDGSGDFPDIQAAIDAARDGDVIQLGYGRFTGDGNRDLSYQGKSITIRSQSGHPQTCILDCEGSAGNFRRAIAFSGEGPGAVLQGVTIENGFMDNGALPFPDCGGGGILFEAGASPTLIDVTIRECGAVAGGGFILWHSSPRFVRCRFEGNGSCGGGGGYCHDGSPEFTECSFVGNTPLQGGGGFECLGGGGITFTDCAFLDNRCLHGGWGGGVEISQTSAVFIRCTFRGNLVNPEGGGGSRCVEFGPPRSRQYDFAGGAIAVMNGQLTVVSCTIVENSAILGGGIGIDTYENEGSIVIVENSILAYNGGGGALTCALPADSVSVSCTDIHGNIGGDWLGCIAGFEGVNGNTSEAPRFCDLPDGDLTLDASSPCAPENSGGCGLIGAWPVACGAAGTSDGSAAGRSVDAGRSLRVFPNPAPGFCRFRICGVRGETAAVEVLDVAGRLVRALARPWTPAAHGCAELEWDRRDAFGRTVPSGVYLARARTASRVLHRRLVLVP